MCSVLERCLVFTNTVFESNIEAAIEIRNSIILELVKLYLEEKTLG
jgi:hypothetical protein